MNNEGRNEEKNKEKQIINGKEEEKDVVYSPLADFFSGGLLTALQYTKVPEDKFKSTLLKLLFIIILTIGFVGVSILLYFVFN